MFVVAGSGRITGDFPDTDLSPGMAVFVPGGETHQWCNTSSTEPFGFVCVVPKGAEAESKPPCG